MGMWISTGPTMDPSQMSLVTSLHCEKQMIYPYLVFLSYMQLLTHERIFPFTPSQISFFMSPWWQTLLKAFQKLSRSYRADRSSLQTHCFLWSRKRIVKHSFIAPHCNYSIIMAFPVCLLRVSDLVVCISLDPSQHLKQCHMPSSFFFGCFK